MLLVGNMPRGAGHLSSACRTEAAVSMCMRMSMGIRTRTCARWLSYDACSSITRCVTMCIYVRERVGLCPAPYPSLS